MVQDMTPRFRAEMESLAEHVLNARKAGTGNADALDLYNGWIASTGMRPVDTEEACWLVEYAADLKACSLKALEEGVRMDKQRREQ